MDISSLEDKVFEQNVPPAAGCLLLSNPFLPDPNFKRSVVLLVEHNDTGTVGFILNKKLDIFIGDLVEEFEPVDNNLFFGGPVQLDSIHYIHRLGPAIENCIDCGNDLYWGGEFEQIREKAKLGLIQTNEARFFLGYSGWAKGQLQDELNEKTWIVIRNQQTNLLDINPDDLWKTILKNKGKEYGMMANFPESPWMN